MGFRFQDHLQHPSVADQPKKGRAQLKRAVFCLFVKQTLYTEYGYPLPRLQISDSMLPFWFCLKKNFFILCEVLLIDTNTYQKGSSIS